MCAPCSSCCTTVLRTFSTSDVGQENSSARSFTIPCHFACWRWNAALSSSEFVIGTSMGRLMLCGKYQTFHRVYRQYHRSLTEDNRRIKCCVNPRENVLFLIETLRVHGLFILQHDMPKRTSFHPNRARWSNVEKHLSKRRSAFRLWLRRRKERRRQPRSWFCHASRLHDPVWRGTCATSSRTLIL